MARRGRVIVRLTRPIASTTTPLAGTPSPRDECFPCGLFVIYLFSMYHRNICLSGYYTLDMLKSTGQLQRRYFEEGSRQNCENHGQRSVRLALVATRFGILPPFPI